MKFRPQRWPSTRSVIVTCALGRFQARVRNVSMTGIRLQLPHALQTGSDFTLALPTKSWEAKVVWCRSTEVGARFAVPLSPSELSALQREGTSGFNHISAARTHRHNHGLRELR